MYSDKLDFHTMPAQGTMKERPILFSSAMVRVILDGRKTQTRRIVKADLSDMMTVGHRGVRHYGRDATPSFDDGAWWFSIPGMSRGPFRCPYGIPSDLLWVRETHYVDLVRDDETGKVCDWNVWYRADEDDPEWHGLKWKSAIHMRRQDSRLTLEIVNVRVERLQEITEDDAKAEGFPDVERPRVAYQQLWDSLNAKRGYGWDKNPWVWKIEFRKLNP